MPSEKSSSDLLDLIPDSAPKVKPARSDDDTPSFPVRVGVAGWSHKSWRGIVYPDPPLPKFDELAYLARFVDFIEVQSTFFQVPPLSTAKRWVDRIAKSPNAKLSLRAWQGFLDAPKDAETTEADSGFLSKPGDYAERALDDFRDISAALQEAGVLERVTAVLGFRQHFTRRRLEAILRFVDHLKDFPCSLAPLHRSWLDDAAMEELAQRDVCLINPDQPAVHEALTGLDLVTAHQRGYRLMGRDQKLLFQEGKNADERMAYFYTEAELEETADRVGEMAKEGPVSVTFANTGRGCALANALQLKALLWQREQSRKSTTEPKTDTVSTENEETANPDKMKSSPVLIPRLLADKYPVLLGLGRLEDPLPENNQQLDLF
jgi:uncharacterized protein YecE (DUF72 family)